MFDRNNFQSSLFLTSEQSFEQKAVALFNYQYQNNETYRQYCKYIKCTPEKIHRLEEIPFLPIEFFKTHAIKTGKWPTQTRFLSSGTTGASRSQHHVRDVAFYKEVARRIFEESYGALESFEFLALLPSYQQQADSSLIYMVDSFISKGKSPSAYYLDNLDALALRLMDNENKKLLIGVSFALLDLAENVHITPVNTIVMETGGMKGRRKEMIRSDLHVSIRSGIQTEQIHSEYGMTELTSQAYGKNGVFRFPNWAKALIRDINDPFTYLPISSTGGINIIDLANIDSCAFIETKDLGKVDSNGYFEVLGRFDNSDIRGCNLLI